ncbi:MAG TPA: ATP-binding cassette domain-containing protein [Actinomycetaceae bacterium]|nr:ATP-binding cassette domain-containing protein [Actinomycetaceae bacterium]
MSHPNPARGDHRAEFLLHARDIATTYRPAGRPPVRAVDGVSLGLERGRTYGLVGESGSGKSTLARSLLRLIEPDAGAITFDGTDLRGLSRRELRGFRRHAQLVFQDPFSSLNPRRTVGDALREALAIHRIARGAAAEGAVVEALETTGLRAEHAARYPHELSGGQRQRVGIARALILRPQLLVLDEPVSALDVIVQEQVLTLLTDLQESLGLTYLFVSHDMSVVRRVSHTVGVMRHGRIVEEGDVADVFAAPTHPYTKLLLDSVPGRRRRAARRVLAG